MELQDKPFWYALLAIAIVGIVYQFDSRLGLLLAVVIALAGLGNMYSAGIIKAAKPEVK